MSDKVQTPLDVDGNSLAEISTMYEVVVARARKTSCKEAGNIISGKEVMPMYWFFDSRIKIPVNDDGKLHMTDEFCAQAQWTRASLLANGLIKQAIPFLGDNDVTVKRTIDGKRADPMAPEFIGMRAQARKMSPAAFQQIQTGISEVWMKGFKTGGIVSAADLQLDSSGTWLASKLITAIINRVYNSPSIFESIYERLAKPIYSIGEINNVFSEMEPAIFQTRMLDNWIDGSVPLEIRKKIVRAILSAATKMTKENSQLQGNVERAMMEAQKSNDDGTSTIDTIKEALKHAYHQTHTICAQAHGEKEIPVVFHLQEERPRYPQRGGRGRGRGGMQQNQRSGSTGFQNQGQRENKNPQGSYGESLTKRVAETEKRMTEMSDMMKEILALHKKRPREGTANAMHVRHEFEGEEDSDNDESWKGKSKRGSGWEKATGFVGMASVVEERKKPDSERNQTKYSGQQLHKKFIQHQKRVEHLLQKAAPVTHHGIGGDRGANNFDQVWHNLGTVGLSPDQVSGDSDEEDEDERVMMDDNGNGIMEKPDGQQVEDPVRNGLAVGDMKSTDDGSVEAGNASVEKEVRRSGRKSMRPDIFKPDTIKSKTSGKTKHDMLTIPGPETVSYSSSEQEIGNSSDSEDMGPINPIKMRGPAPFKTKSGIPFQLVSYGVNKSVAHFIAGNTKRLQKAERNLPDHLKTKNPFDYMTTGKVNTAQKRGAKESISAEIIDCLSELEENVNNLGSGHIQGVPDGKRKALIEREQKSIQEDQGSSEAESGVPDLTSLSDSSSDDRE